MALARPFIGQEPARPDIEDDARLEWELMDTYDFANANVAGATFAVDGVTFTFGSKANGTISSDANGIAIDPSNLAITPDVSPRFYVPLANLVPTLNWLNDPEIFIWFELGEAANLNNSGAVGATDDQRIFCSIGDTDVDPSFSSTALSSNTAPNGQGHSSIRRSSVADQQSKAGVSNDTIRHLGIRHYGGMASLGYFSTAVTPTVDDALATWTSTGVRATSEAQNPNSAGPTANVIFGCLRNATAPAFVGKLRKIRIYRRTAIIS